MSGSYALWLTALLTVALSALSVYLVLRISAGSPGSSRDMVVMCADGHLFTTVWIPGVSFKAIRLGRARFQTARWAITGPRFAPSILPGSPRGSGGSPQLTVTGACHESGSGGRGAHVPSDHASTVIVPPR